jgi:hypothetical protein
MVYARAQQDIASLAPYRDLAQHQGEPSGRAEVSIMMTNERKIWEAALMLVRRHGSEALQVAEREAERLRSGDDELSCIVWCWIARSTAELLRPTPGSNERIH